MDNVLLSPQEIEILAETVLRAISPPEIDTPPITPSIDDEMVPLALLASGALLSTPSTPGTQTTFSFGIFQIN